MCGIVGYINLSIEAEFRDPLLRKMCDTLYHRGPDDEGYYFDNDVGLGMRRLSIIDLKGGQQPLMNEDGNLHLVYNGEIYNYKVLRQSLIQKGHRFKTNSDSEVIIHQYEQDGPQCVNHFNGMFAFAVWDKARRSLFLARDRMGVKPLYYYWDGRCFLFASEIKAILSSGYVERKINERALWDYLTFRYVPQPDTIWANIFKLPPGHNLTIDADNPDPILNRYWDIPYGDNHENKSEDEYVHEFESLFKDSVKLRLISDVPVGVLLSGGLDSSSVAAAVREVHDGAMCSFNVAFRDSPGTDESSYARKVAEHVGMDHHEIVIDDRDFTEYLPKYVCMTDEPLADLASVPLHYVCSLAKNSVKVVLSGEGSDEILGGYDFDRVISRWKWIEKYQRLPSALRSSITSLFTPLVGENWGRKIKIANMNLDAMGGSYALNMTNYLDSNEKRLMFKGGATFRDSDEVVRADAARVSTRELLHKYLYVYCQSWLVEDLLMKADRMTMANSIELRVPFLDYRLVEWAAKAPAWTKIGGSGKAKSGTKRMLRGYAKGRLPDSIIRRPKQGFPVPVYGWLGNNLSAWAKELLASNDTKVCRWLTEGAVRQQLDRGTAPGAPLIEQHRLWNLLILELWMREWKPT